MKKKLSGLAIILIAVVGCTTHQKVVKVETQVQEVKKEERSLKRKVAIARFTNETQYAKGIFYDKNNNNPVEKQAADILATKLSASGKFLLLERQDLDKILEEIKLNGGNDGMQKGVNGSQRRLGHRGGSAAESGHGDCRQDRRARSPRRRYRPICRTRRARRRAGGSQLPD